MEVSPSRQDWIALALLPGFTALRCGELMHGAAVREPAGGRPDDWLRRARAQIPMQRVEALLRQAQDLGTQVLTPADDHYPWLLRALNDPPPLLFVRGEPALLARPQLAVVGSRRASPRGLRLAGWLADELSRAGLIVTSGLARGVDAAAHHGALDAGCPTIAVLGHGIDRVYPSAHRSLARRIAAHGALISEFMPGAPVHPSNFPRRNRIVSGLTLGVVVVEAAARSGSLITARLAAEQGREVFALPGPARDPGLLGCHQLIQQGAKLVTCLADVFDELPLEAPGVETTASGPAGTADDANPEQQQILAALDDEGSDFDRLAERTGLPSAQLSAALVTLELAGLLARDGSLFLRADGG